MDKYDDLAEKHGVTLAPFTEDYLNLYGSQGLKLLEGFIRGNRSVKRISTGDLLVWVGRDRQTTLDI